MKKNFDVNIQELVEEKIFSFKFIASRLFKDVYGDIKWGQQLTTTEKRKFHKKKNNISHLFLIYMHIRIALYLFSMVKGKEIDKVYSKLCSITWYTVVEWSEWVFFSHLVMIIIIILKEETRFLEIAFW